MSESIVRIPQERIAVLIGKNGKTKKFIEEQTNSKLNIDSKTGEIIISDKNGVNLLKATSIVKAIGRGFSPEQAELLLEDDVFLEIIDLNEVLGKSQSKINIRKGRVIGKEGATRKKIEETTDTKISVYGKTIAFIGQAENIETARKAVEMLLEGATHNKVYDFLNKKLREKIKFEL